MTQATGVQEFFEAMVEVRPVGGAWTDISGWGATVAVGGRERQVGEIYSHDGDHAIVGRGKLQPLDVTVRAIYTDGGLDPYAIVLPALENHTVLQVRWSPYGGQAGEKQYTTDATHSHVTSCPAPSGEAGSGDPIMLEFMVRTSDIAAAAISPVCIFPETAILDNFNRADEGPPPSASWTTPAGFDGLQVVSLECANLVGIGECIWVTAFNAGQEARVTVPARQDDESEFYILARYQDADNKVFIDIVRDDDTNDIVEISETVAGVTTLIGGPYIIADYLDGDAFGMCCQGAIITAYYRSVGGGVLWTTLGTGTTTLPVAGGQIGLEAWDATIRLDDFGGGNC